MCDLPTLTHELLVGPFANGRFHADISTLLSHENARGWYPKLIYFGKANALSYKVEGRSLTCFDILKSESPFEVRGWPNPAGLSTKSVLPIWRGVLWDFVTHSLLEPASCWRAVSGT